MQRILATPGEGILTVAATHALGGAAGISAINSAFGGGGRGGMLSSGGVPMFGWGGIVSAIGDVVSGVGSTVKNVAGDVGGAIVHGAMGVGDFFTGNFKGAGQQFSQAGGDALKGLKDAVQGSLQTAVKAFFDAVVKPMVAEIAGFSGGSSTVQNQLMVGTVNNFEKAVLDWLG